MNTSNILETILNSDFLKLVAVLTSIILVVYFLVNNKKNDKDSKVHIYYITGFCSLIVIELVTYICVNNNSSDEVIKYISFASTLSSLLLSVVAIIYAIVSNNKADVQYQKIDKASNKISESIDEFSTLSNELSKNLRSISDKIDEIKSITDQTRIDINSFVNDNQNNPILPIDNKLINRFLVTGSYSGNLALLACVYSKDKRKPIVLSKLFGNNAKYSYGYIVASSAFGIIETICTDAENVTVNKYNLDDLENKLHDVIDAALQNCNEEYKAEFERQKEEVERYFR